MSDTVCGWPWTTCLEIQVILNLWVPQLELGVCSKDESVHQGWPLPASGLGACHQESSGTLRFISACLDCQLLVKLNH